MENSLESLVTPRTVFGFWIRISLHFPHVETEMEIISRLRTCATFVVGKNVSATEMFFVLGNNRQTDDA